MSHRKSSKNVVYVQLALTVLIGLLLTVPLVGSAKDQTGLGDPYAGQQLFESKGCISCHKVYDKGGKGGPDLGKKNYCGTFLSLAAVMWNHSPKMLAMVRQKGMAIDVMDKEQISQIISYLCFVRFRNDEGDIFRGRKLLEKKGCLNCHASDGSLKAIAPDFTTLRTVATPLYLAQQMWNHGPKILRAEEKRGLKHVTLTGDDIQNISAALRDMTRSGTVKTEFSTLGNIKHGEQLFRQKGCANCHEDTKEPQAPDLHKANPDMEIMQIASAMWNHGPNMWKTMQEQGVEHPTFNGTDMADLVSYLFYEQYMVVTGQPQQGKDVFEQKKCANCHVKAGEQSEAKIALPEIHTPLDMVESMWNHMAGMQDKMVEEKIEFPKLEEKDMMDLYSFLSNESE